jgi:hypothetical protein
MPFMRRAVLVTIVLTTGVTASAASADVQGWNFEPGGFATGNVNGQDGWLKSGATVDATVVANTGVNAAAFGRQSLRLANGAAPTGGITDQPITGGVVDGAGETASATNGMAGGLRQPNFDASFSFRSRSGAYVPGLRFTASPTDGQQGRNGFVAVEDRLDGLAVVFTDVPDTTLVAGHTEFVDHDIATGLDRATTHTIRISSVFVEGLDNDVVHVYVDGALAVTGTSWENYYRNDTEQALYGNVVPVVDQLVFRMNTQAAGPVAPADGLLVDDVRLESFGGAGGSAGPAGSVGPAGSAGPAGAAGAPGVSVPGAKGADGPPPVAAQNGFAGVRLTKLQLGKKAVRFSVSCPASAGLCAGRVAVSSSRYAAIGGRSFVLGAGHTTAVRLTLGPVAQRRLAASRDHVRFQAFARDRAGYGATTSRRATVR